ncbi:MAG TPA: type II secretion system minor pseudopilin GspK [Burkholderiaceae bacterium]|jgi:general secretion pathway protein K|nr:type II secretion system minor pseudopilin GspK [Burkholderiaceae bacterium]
MTLRDSTKARGSPPAPGAALLLAMLILVLVATMASGMVWIQFRGIEVEQAERVRAQGEWLLNGAIDWSRLILREDARGPNVDYIGEPWSIPLAETRLSTFLAGANADTTSVQADTGPDAFLSGQITDAAGLYNLQILMQTTVTRANQQQFERLCVSIGVPVEVADQIAAGLADSSSAIDDADEDDPTSKAPANTILEPGRVAELAWYGVDPKWVKMLEPFVDVLPQVMPVNANTAPAEVLMAMVPGLNRGDAQRMIAMRQSQPFTKSTDITAALPPALAASAATSSNYNLAWSSSFFEVLGQLRYEQHIIRERTLVQRVGLNTIIIRRVRLSPVDS